MSNKIPLFKCRASCGGKIMTEPQGKSNLEKYTEAKEKLESLKKRLSEFKNQDCKSAVTIKNETIPTTEILVSELEKVKDKKELSKTCRQYLKEWILNQKYGRKKDFTSKYTEKGLLTEQAGFQLIQEVQFKGREIFLNKNKKEFEDDYFTGMPDLILLDWILDNKSSWDLFTFPIDDEEIPVDGYDYQGRIYLRLADKINFLLCYTLNDIPLIILEDEFSRFKYQAGLIDYTDQQYYDFTKHLIFTNKGLNEAKSMLFSTADTSDFIEIPKEKRYKSFLVERDLEIESKMIERVKECRIWIEENWDKY